MSCYVSYSGKYTFKAQTPPVTAEKLSEIFSEVNIFRGKQNGNDAS